MNWLAHLYLSEPTSAFRLGNLMPDLASTAELAALPLAFQPGIRCHQQIDAFTDAHASFRRSVQRFSPPLRRYGGILVDIFYDHLLARDWRLHAPMPLGAFAAEVYQGFEQHWSEIPETARSVLERMRTANWLCAYADLDGIALTLERVSRRLRRPFDLTTALPVFLAQERGFTDDFQEFFPELKSMVQST